MKQSKAFPVNPTPIWKKHAGRTSFSILFERRISAKFRDIRIEFFRSGFGGHIVETGFLEEGC
jgi:hypothetical protein